MMQSGLIKRPLRFGRIATRLSEIRQFGRPHGCGIRIPKAPRASFEDAIANHSYFLGKSIIMFTMIYTTLNWWWYRGARMRGEDDDDEGKL